MSTGKKPRTIFEESGTTACSWLVVITEHCCKLRSGESNVLFCNNCVEQRKDEMGRED
jgi:hypothetical protein